ncbi:hypothetical protein ARSEF4850_010016 [Beauveria asiatica]
MSHFMNSTEHFGLAAAAMEENEPVQPQKPVEKVWAEQSVLISSLADRIAVDEHFGETPSGGAGHFATFSNDGKTVDVTPELAKVKVMKDNGALKIALDHLSKKFDPKAGRAVSAAVTVKMAQLMCIMSSCVYKRDAEAEKTVHENMQPFAAKIKEAKKKNLRLDDATQKAITDASKKVDKVTSQIQSVATAMGLKYQPLCNFSSEGSLMRNGPYCGAFYREADVKTKTPAMMVIAFKGTGKVMEIITDLKFSMKDAAGASPLKGKFHAGFFDGVFKNFVSDLAVNGAMPEILPFQLLRNQMFSLSEKIAGATNPEPVQVWVTGHSLGAAYATICWEGLLATQAKVKQRAYRDLCTFGSPRVANEVNGKNANSVRTHQNCWRFHNGTDIIATVPLYRSGWRHLDTVVNISKTSIALGPSELISRKTPELSSKGAILPSSSDHKLESYWESLTKGRILGQDSWKLETVSDRPAQAQSATDRLVTWSLNPDLQQESAVGKINPDDYLGGKESIHDKHRHEQPGMIDHIQTGNSKPSYIYEKSNTDEYVGENPDAPIEEARRLVTPNPAATPIERLLPNSCV